MNDNGTMEHQCEVICKKPHTHTKELRSNRRPLMMCVQGKNNERHGARVQGSAVSSPWPNMPGRPPCNASVHPHLQQRGRPPSCSPTRASTLTFTNAGLHPAMWASVLTFTTVGDRHHSHQRGRQHSKVAVPPHIHQRGRPHCNPAVPPDTDQSKRTP